MLLLAGCGGNDYKPVDDSFDTLLKGRTATDSLFVSTIGAATAEAFDAGVTPYLQAYARDFDDPGLSAFSPATPYAERQDSLLFLMQDYLLNTFRYDESIELGRYLDNRLAEGHNSGTPLHSAALGDIAVAYFY